MTRPSYFIRAESMFLRQGRCFGRLSVPEASSAGSSDASGAVTASAAAITRVALVVLPPGPEQARCYRLLRGLAVTLASQGIAVLRLELSGTGSTVSSIATTRVEDWHADICAAAAVLRTRWPDAALLGVGVRFGARLLLDALTAGAGSRDPDGGDLRGLVCLSPLLSGSEWVDHLQKVQAAMKFDHLQLDDADLAGQRWPALLLAQAREQKHWPDLAALPFSPKFILESDSSIENLSDYKQRLIGLNSNEWCSGGLPMVVSAEACSAVVDALLGEPAGLMDTPAASPLTASPPIDNPSAEDSPKDNHPFFLGGFQATAQPFSQGLFGMYRPGQAACPVVVMLNSGLLDCSGPYGMYVDLAERLSQQGIASVRFDFSGKGESARKPVAGLDAVLDDYAQLSDFLHSKGHQQTILLGICSGADDALELAHLTDNVVGLVLLDGYALKTSAFTRHYWQERLTSPARITAWLKRKAAALFSRGNISSPADPQQPTFELRRWASPAVMRARYCDVLERQCATLALFTGALQDDYYNHAEQLTQALGRPAGLTELYRPHLGHLYPASSQREELFGLITHWLSGTFLSGAGTDDGGSNA